MARADLVQAMLRAGREQSDASVMFHTAIAERMGLSVTEGKTIGVLDRLGPLSAGELAAQTGLATASVTSLIDRLEAKGVARRVRDARDRRRVIVELRPERLSGMSQLYESLVQAFTRLTEVYRDDELAVILDSMVRATGLLREETAKVTQSAERTAAPAASLPAARPRPVAEAPAPAARNRRTPTSRAVP